MPRSSSTQGSFRTLLERRPSLQLIVSSLLPLLVIGCSSDAPVPPDPPSISEGESEGAEAMPSSAYEIGSGDVASVGRGTRVVFVRAVQESESAWRFEVTIEGPNEGPKNFVDGWDVVNLDGDVIKPDPSAEFTHALSFDPTAASRIVSERSGIELAIGTDQVRVRAHARRDGYGGREVIVYMNTEAGPDYEVVHTY